MKKYFSILALPLLAACPSMPLKPDTPIDANAVAPLWNQVLGHYDELVREHVPATDPRFETYMLDAELLRNVLREAQGIE